MRMVKRLKMVTTVNKDLNINSNNIRYEGEKQNVTE
jgi:hypothetical protein